MRLVYSSARAGIRLLKFEYGIVVGLVGFYKEVKAEILKVTWPSRKETLMAVGLVLLLASLAGMFFLVVDAILFRLVQFILGV